MDNKNVTWSELITFITMLVGVAGLPILIATLVISIFK
jgi:hypothetical protein